MRRIYADYLAGIAPKTIARSLTDEQIPTPMGRTTWTSTTVRSILTNEKYNGDALLQKTYTVDFLTKTVKRNKGEVAQYYVTGHHEPIIEPAVWDRVQAELARRRTIKTCAHPLAARIICSQCGGIFGPKTWHAGTDHEKRIWRCNYKYGPNPTGCTTPHVHEHDIQEAFERALTNLTPPPSRQVLQVTLEQTCDDTRLRQQLEEHTIRRDAIIARTDQLIHTNATSVQDQDAYDQAFDSLQADYDKAQAAIDRTTQAIEDMAARRGRIIDFHTYRTNHPGLTYTDEAWRTLVDHATVNPDGIITITLVDGTTI